MGARLDNLALAKMIALLPLGGPMITWGELVTDVGTDLLLPS